MTLHPTPLQDLPEDWQDFTRAVMTEGRVLASGLPGTGKSYLANTLAAHPSGQVLDVVNDVYNLTLHEDCTANDILGGFLPRAGKWDWRAGPGQNAWDRSWHRPVRLVLNELDQAAGAVMTALLGILDDPESARITLPCLDDHGDSITIRPNPENLQIISTMNGSHEDLIPALLDRHGAKVKVDSAHPDSIARLPLEWQEVAKGMTAPTARHEGRGTTPRDWHALHRMVSRGLTLAEASRLVWTPERAKEVADHLVIAGADPAARIAPAPVAVSVPVAIPAPAPTATAMQRIKPTCGHLSPVLDPSGHYVDPSDGTSYPDATGEAYCLECLQFFAVGEYETVLA